MTGFLSVQTTIDSWRLEMTNIQQEQIPFAAMIALNDCVEIAQYFVRDEEKKVFDRPTPFTLDATYIRRATKQRLQASIEIKNESFKANPAEKWLSPEVYGGERPLKRFEAALQRIGVLPAGMFCVPANGAQRDSYGNMSRGQIVQILSWFQAFGEQGYAANSTAATRRRKAKTTARKYGTAYFALQQRRGQLRPGIYQRTSLARGSAVRPVLEFVRQPLYRSRLSFFATVEKVTNERFAERFELALARALATSTIGR